MVYVLAGFAVLLGTMALVIKAEHAQRVHDLPLKVANTYSLAAIVLGGVGGFGFLGAGVLAHARRPENRVGLLMVLVGAGFFAEDLQLSSSGVGAQCRPPVRPGVQWVRRPARLGVPGRTVGFVA
jgi:hypothetical protein